MMKKAIGALALLVIVAGFTAPASAAIEGSWGWIYLSAVPDHYDCGKDMSWAAGETKPIYVMLETPADSWGASDAFLGIDFGMDYPATLFVLHTTSPSAPAPLIFGSCDAGHCSIQTGYGGGVNANPHVAMQFDMMSFGEEANMGFYLLPSDIPPVGASTPVWILDTGSPPKYVPQPGDGTIDHPGWQQGFLVFNYDQATAPATVFPPYTPAEGMASWALFNAGNPCDRGKIVPAHESTWGAFKAGY